MEKPQRFEFKFPFLVFRTKALLKLFDRLGSLRLFNLASTVAIVVSALVVAVALYLILNNFLTLLTNPKAGEVIRNIGPEAYILLPGVNPLLPLVYGWIAVIFAIVVHEVAHGIAARSLGLNVNSSGLLLLLFIPIGAFVEVDEEQLKRSKPTTSSRVLASGVAANTATAILSLLLLMIIISGLRPIIDGVYVYDVYHNMPAASAGLLPGDVIISINNIRVNSTVDLADLLRGKKQGEIVYVTVARGEGWRQLVTVRVNLTASDNRVTMGVKVGDLMTWEILRSYQRLSLSNLFLYLVPPTIASNIVPFSDFRVQFYTHWLGPYWHVLASMLYWLWFINFNIAIFNALPIYPLDGGRILNTVLKNIKCLGRYSYGITIAITVIILTIVAMSMIIPFLEIS